jgi:hypothetical protein
LPRWRREIQAFRWFFCRLKVKVGWLKWNLSDLNASTFECNELAKPERHIGCHACDLLERTSKSWREQQTDTKQTTNKQTNEQQTNTKQTDKWQMNNKQTPNKQPTNRQMTNDQQTNN